MIYRLLLLSVIKPTQPLFLGYTVDSVISRSLFRETALISDTEDEDFGGAPVFPHHHLSRKQRRKTRTARRIKEEGEEPPIIRGLWVQEIDWLKSADSKLTISNGIIPPPPQFTDSVAAPCVDPLTRVYEGLSAAANDASPSEDQCGLRDTEDTSSSDNREASDSESIRTHESDSDSSCCAGDGRDCAHSSEDALEIHSRTHAIDRFGQEANVSDLTFDLMGVSGFDSAAESSREGTSASFHRCAEASSRTQSLLGIPYSTYAERAVSISGCSLSAEDVCDVDTVLGGLRGRVTQLSRHFVRPFFNDLIKHMDDGRKSVSVNEGLLFHTVRHLHL